MQVNGGPNMQTMPPPLTGATVAADKGYCSWQTSVDGSIQPATSGPDYDEMWGDPAGYRGMFTSGDDAFRTDTDNDTGMGVYVAHYRDGDGYGVDLGLCDHDSDGPSAGGGR